MKPRRIDRITVDIVEKVKPLLGKKSQRSIARELRISQTTVHYIYKGVYDDPYRQLPTTISKANNKIFDWSGFKKGVI